MTLLHSRLHGPDPLDYITMFANPGNPHEGVHAHWHYVSCGLSDLHGDGRVHEYVKTVIVSKLIVFDHAFKILADG